MSSLSVYQLINQTINVYYYRPYSQHNLSHHSHIQLEQVYTILFNQFIYKDISVK